MGKPIRDMGASIRARLLKLAQERGHSFDLLLTRYAIERLLFRLGTTAHRTRFVLKGGTLITTWFDQPHRPTRDVDFLGRGDSTPESVLTAFQEICAQDFDDGIAYDVNGLRVELIREELDYGGLRLRTMAQLAGARITVVIDIGFGDDTEPGVEEVSFPTLMDFPAPQLLAYPRETVIAEKFQAMVQLGLANTRLKDYYDVWLLSTEHKFDADRLARTISATFQRRRTALPLDLPDALTPAFATAPAKRQQWLAFAQDLDTKPPALDIVAAQLAQFLMPHARQARSLSHSQTPS